MAWSFLRGALALHVVTFASPAESLGDGAFTTESLLALVGFGVIASGFVLLKRHELGGLGQTIRS